MEDAMTFEKWFRQVFILAITQFKISNDLDIVLNENVYHNYYDEGLTPEEALISDYLYL